MTARYNPEDPNREKYMAAEQEKLAKKKAEPEWHDLTGKLDKENDDEEQKDQESEAA